MSHPAFSADDKAFILKILSNPAELTAWLIYADWLDEHDNPQHAEFLRLMARRGQLSNTQIEYYEAEFRLEELRTTLPAVWVEVFDRPKIENCEPAFRFQCPKQWEKLKITDKPTVRHCDTCNKDVYYCRTLPEAQGHAREDHCVAVQLGVPRYPDDLKPRIREDDEREDLDEVMGMLTWESPPEPRRPWWKFW